MTELLVGTAVVDMTPPVGTYLMGYASRKGSCTGVHDRLYASALVVDDGQMPVAIVSMETCDVPTRFGGEVRAAIHQATGMPAANVLLCATHTHGGADLYVRKHSQAQEVGDIYDGDDDGDAAVQINRRNLAYRAQLVDKLAQVAAAAWKNRKAATMRIGKRILDTSAKSRRPKGGPTDPEVGVLLVEADKHQPTAVLVNFACHGSTLGSDNQLITADWMGFMRDTIKAQLGPNVTVMFTSGASGDINPGGYDPELSMIGDPTPDRTWAHAERLGTTVGKGVLRLLPEMTVMKTAVTRSLSRPAVLHLYPQSDPADAARRLAQQQQLVAKLEAEGADRQALAIARTQLEYEKQNVYRSGSEEFVERPVFAEIHCVRIGDAYFIGIPGEPFCEIALGIKRKASTPWVFPVGLANASYGYLVTDASYPQGGYEPHASRFKPGVDTAIVDTALSLVEALSS